MPNKLSQLVAIVTLVWAAPVAEAAIQFSQNLTSNVIYGTGNQDGGFTTDRVDSIELGLRTHRRFPTASDNAAGIMDQGNGDYGPFAAQGFAAGNNRASWNFDWSINTDYQGTTGDVVDDYTYLIEIDYNTGYGTNFLSFDPIHGFPFTPNPPDHSFGNNATPNDGSAAEAPGNVPAYTALMASNNVVQNSWQLNFFEGGPYQHDPFSSGLYDVRLSAFDGTTLVAQTSIQVIVGAGAVPEPLSVITWGGLAMCAGWFSLRARKGFCLGL